MIFPSKLDSTRPKQNKQSKGGSITKTDRFNRKSLVEKNLRSGMSVNDMVLLGIGSKQTILHDIDEIHKSWIDQDVEWSKRIVLARLEAVKNLKEQHLRLLTYLKIPNLAMRDKALIENLIQKIVIAQKEVSSEISPDEYINRDVAEKIDYLVSRSFDSIPKK